MESTQILRCKKDNKFRGKRAELNVYDDAWIRGDDGEEFIVPSPRLMHDRITTERHKIINDGINEWFLKLLPLDEILKECGDNNG